MNVNEVFGGKTTFGHDYTVPKLEETKRYHTWSRDPKTKEKVLQQKPYRPVDLHTMRNVRRLPPFDLLWETKDILRTYPVFTFTPKEKEQDPKKEEVIKSRPRLYVSPAVSMDDIADREVRDLLVKHTYATSFEAATEPLHLKVTQRKVPNCTFEKIVDPIRFDPSTFKPIPENYRKVGKDWERNQYVSLVDPHKKFWTGYKKDLRRDPGQGLVSESERAEIRSLVEKDELRMPYDKLKPKYAGYVPRNVIGPLRQQNLSNK